MSRLVTFPTDVLAAHALGGPQPLSQDTIPTGAEERLLWIGRAIEKVVVESYSTRPMAHRTTAEDARRAGACVEWFNRLVNQFRWTPDRALSVLRIVLTDVIDGKAPDIEDANRARMWAPDKTLVRGLA